MTSFAYDDFDPDLCRMLELVREVGGRCFNDAEHGPIHRDRRCRRCWLAKERARKWPPRETRQ